jgi:hypothetical protein
MARRSPAVASIAAAVAAKSAAAARIARIAFGDTALASLAAVGLALAFLAAIADAVVATATRRITAATVIVGVVVGVIVNVIVGVIVNVIVGIIVGVVVGIIVGIIVGVIVGVGVGIIVVVGVARRITAAAVVVTAVLAAITWASRRTTRHAAYGLPDTLPKGRCNRHAISHGRQSSVVWVTTDPAGSALSIPVPAGNPAVPA